MVALWGGTGAAQTMVTSLDGDRAFGLARSDAEPSLTSIDFAVVLEGDGQARAYQHGTPMPAPPITYQVGDSFRVAVEYDLTWRRNVVNWYKNADPLPFAREFTPTLTYPLVVAASLFSPEAQLAGLYLAGENSGPLAQGVQWTELAGVTASGNSLTKTGPNQAWDAGARSTISITQDLATGYGQVTVGLMDGDRAFGLARSSAGQSLGDIDFALVLEDGGQVRAYQHGTLVPSRPTTYQVGDSFRVAVEYDSAWSRNVVNWYKNADPLPFTSVFTPTLVYPLVLNTSLFSPGARIEMAYLIPTGNRVLPTSTPGAGPTTTPTPFRPTSPTASPTPARQTSPTPTPIGGMP
jgi:hypothetical protein